MFDTSVMCYYGVPSNGILVLRMVARIISLVV